MNVKDGALILFQGDSITDAGRDKNSFEDLGPGYPRKIAEYFKLFRPEKNFRVLNRGISGHKAPQLEERWDRDCIDLHPDVVSILVGVNDAWHVLKRGYEGTPEDYRRSYECIIQRTLETGAEVVILEPYIVPASEENNQIKPLLAPLVDIARELALKYHTTYVPLEGLFWSACTSEPPASFSIDGVHPTGKGHAFIARKWLEFTDLL